MILPEAEIARRQGPVAFSQTRDAEFKDCALQAGAKALLGAETGRRRPRRRRGCPIEFGPKLASPRRITAAENGFSGAELVSGPTKRLRDQLGDSRLHSRPEITFQSEKSHFSIETCGNSPDQFRRTSAFGAGTGA
jgi:hypothetical protein